MGYYVGRLFDVLPKSVWLGPTVARFLLWIDEVPLDRLLDQRDIEIWLGCLELK